MVEYELKVDLTQPEDRETDEKIVDEAKLLTADN